MCPECCGLVSGHFAPGPPTAHAAQPVPPTPPAAPPLRRPPPRGAVLPFILITLTVLIGAVALAIDLNRLHATATEVRGVADAAALG